MRDTIRLAPHTMRPCPPIKDTAQTDGRMLSYLNDMRVPCIRCWYNNFFRVQKAAGKLPSNRNAAD